MEKEDQLVWVHTYKKTQSSYLTSKVLPVTQKLYQNFQKNNLIMKEIPLFWIGNCTKTLQKDDNFIGRVYANLVKEGLDYTVGLENEPENPVLYFDEDRVSN